MRHDKEKVFELRREGKTYREIEKLLTISRSTLCDWFKNEKWSNHIKELNNKVHLKISIEHLSKLNEGRRIMLEEKYKKVEDEAIKEFEVYKTDPLFIAGLMLYAGEGDKMTKNVIRLANVDFFIHKIFLKFIEKFTKVRVEKIRISILLYPDLDMETCKNKWAQELNIPVKNFHKPQVILGRSKIKRLHFGVGSTIISNSFLKRKLLKWIELSKIHLGT
jgi:hypothetical protein